MGLEAVLLALVNHYRTAALGAVVERLAGGER